MNDAVQVHSEASEVVSSLDMDLIEGLFETGAIAPYADLFWAARMGSALKEGDIIEAGWRALNIAGKPAAKLAVAGAITQAWYAINYPLIGGVLQTASGLPLIGGFVATKFGPPALFLDGGVFAALLAISYPIRHVVDGAKQRQLRNREIQLASVTLLVLVATAESDQGMSADNLRVLQDFLRSLPKHATFQPQTEMGELTARRARAIALKRAEEAKLSKDEKEAVLNFGILMALADGDIYAGERRFLREVAGKLDAADIYTKLEKQLQNAHKDQLHMAEASLRVVHAIACVDGELKEDAAELLDMLLINLVGPSKERDRLLGILKPLKKGKFFARKKLVRRFQDADQGLFNRLNPLTKSPDDQAVDQVIDIAISFIHSLEMLRDPDSDNNNTPQKLRQHRAMLCNIAEKYDIDDDEIYKRIDKYRAKMQKMANKRALLSEETLQSVCPNPACAQRGHFKLNQQRYLLRNEYECSNCKQRAHMCRVPNCRQMAAAGDFWDEELCEEHTLL